MLFLLLFLPPFALAASYQPKAVPQNNTFNSSFSFTPAQLEQYQLSADEAENIQVAVNFERSNWANTGSVNSDTFYNVPSSAVGASPGTLLKVETTSNTTYYSLPPNVALSRILFQTKNLNGTAVPASAYILWPWLPQTFSNVRGIPVVAWAHGTSGWFGECAPSHMRDLWYEFRAPFELALEGYAVVAPDFAGLGVTHDAKGQLIVHQYLANHAAANDLFYAVEAAQKAFSNLSNKFVVFGHSQGGGAAWAAAARQAIHPFPGYLGTIAASPTTSISGLYKYVVDPFGSLALTTSYAIQSVFPSFKPSDWLTAAGVLHAEILQSVAGCIDTNKETASLGPNALSTYASTWYFQAYDKLTTLLGKRVVGPILVLQGTADPTVNITITNEAVGQLCTAYPKTRLQYSTFANVSHIPVLSASRRIWRSWIAERFSEVEVPPKCITTHYEPALASQQYQSSEGYYLSYPLYAYET